MSEHVFKLPDLGEGTVESEIGEWFIKVGDNVAEEDIVATMMTDKAAVEISSPVSGKVSKLAGEPGDIVAVGAPLIVFETSGNGADTSPVKEVEAVAPTPEPAPTRVAETAQEQVSEPAPPLASETTQASNGRSKIVTSPAIRRRAKEAGIDLSRVAGSGPNGRILRSDLDQYLGPAAPAAPSIVAPAADKEVKVIGLRRMIAERMTAANTEIPHFSYVEECDITDLETLRKHLNAKKSDASGRLTLLPFISLALMRALREFPQCNATYDKARNVVVQHGAVHLGIATQTPDGLKVPVVKNASTMTLEAFAAEVQRVSEAARNNTSKKDVLSGSTITITSLGKLGGIVTTPVINMPEVAIIGVNRAIERPVIVDGQVAVRMMMNLSSSFDHRFVDGYDAAAMIQRVKELLENPATIFMPA